MEKQKKSVGTIALVVLLLIVTVVSLILATYAWAKYTTTTGPTEATANVAKWNVSFTDSNTVFSGTYNHVVSGKIAPGTNGSFTITPNVTGTEVCFDYVITIDKIEFYKGGTLIANDAEEEIHNDAGNITYLSAIRDHIRFTYDNGTAGNTSDDVDVTPTSSAAGTAIKGKYELGETNHNENNATTTPANVTINWSWPYTDPNNASNATWDAIDTYVGEYANDNTLTMKITYTATATQTNPTNGHPAN